MRLPCLRDTKELRGGKVRRRDANPALNDGLARDVCTGGSGVDTFDLCEMSPSAFDRSLLVGLSPRIGPRETGVGASGRCEPLLEVRAMAPPLRLLTD